MVSLRSYIDATVFGGGADCCAEKSNSPKKSAAIIASNDDIAGFPVSLQARHKPVHDLKIPNSTPHLEHPRVPVEIPSSFGGCLPGNRSSASTLGCWLVEQIVVYLSHPGR